MANTKLKKAHIPINNVFTKNTPINLNLCRNPSHSQLPTTGHTTQLLLCLPVNTWCVLHPVKLSSAVATILVGFLKCRTQFWKRTTQESFQHSLVEIGSVVSEEKIFLKFHPPFFLICIIGQNRQKFKVHKKSRNIC